MKLKTVISIFLILITPALASAADTGKVYANGEKHKIVVNLPANAPSITSDFSATLNRGKGSIPHGGMDIRKQRGSAVIAMADGVVGSVKKAVRMANGDLRVAVIHHNQALDKPLVILYNGVIDVIVKKGDKIKRGQKIAAIGKKDYIHIGAWFDRKTVANPHEHWIDGPGKVVCFDTSSNYKNNGKSYLTYPVECE